jgi:hypothetical protein
MSITLVNQIRKQANLIGYKPRLGVEIFDLGYCFSRSAEFDVILYSGANGATDSVADDTMFTVAGETFDDDGYIEDDYDILIIDSGVNAGEHIITSVDSNTQLVCSGSTFVTATGQEFRVVRRYHDLLSSFPDFKTYTEQMGGYSPQGDLSLGVLNQELFSDIFATYANPENSEVNCYLYFDDGSAMTYSERVLVSSGKIKTFPRIDYNRVGFSVTDDNILLNKKVGTLLEGSDGANGVTLPDTAIGKIKPIIYGSHLNYCGRATGTLSGMTCERENNMVPMVWLGVDDNNYSKWMIAGHAISTAIVTTDLVWGLDSSLGRFVELVATPVAMTNDNTNGATISYQANDALSYRDILFGDGTVSGEANILTGDWVNAERAGDNDEDTTAVSTLGPADLQAATAVIYIDFDPTYENSRTIGTVGLYIKFELTRGSGLLDSEVHFFVDGTDYGPTKVGTGVVTVFLHNISGGGVAGMQKDILISHFRDQTGANTDTVCTIYEIWKKGTYSTRDFIPLFSAIEGREYGTWVDDRDAAEGYTEDHIDNDGSGNLIENAAGVVESILRDELDMGNETDPASSFDTDLYRDSFNIASNDLSTTEMSLSIIKQEDWIPSLSGICETLKSNLAFNNENRLRMLIFNGPAGFSASGSTAPSSWDIYEDSPVQTFKLIASYNDLLHFNHTVHGTTFISIPAGEYTGATLAARLQSRMILVEAAATCTYNSSTGKFSLSFPNVTFFLWYATSSRQIGRYIGFYSSKQSGTTTTSGFGLWADSWNENPIIAGSFSLSKQKEDIVTDLTVLYGLNDGTGEYQYKSNVVDNTYHAETIENAFKHNGTKDSTTAIIYRAFLADRLAKRHYVATFKTFMNAIHLETWDIINIRHPIIEGIFTAATMNAKEWLVLSITISTSNMEITVKAIEV